MIAGLSRKASRYLHADPEQRSLFLRVPPVGAISYTVIVKRQRRQTWHVVGSTDELTVDQAREKAREVIRRVKAGLPPIEPIEPEPQSVTAVCRNWLTRVVDANKHRSAYEQRRVVEKYIVPHVGDRVFAELRRRDVALLLDKLQDNHGPQQTDAVLTTLSSVCHWMATRDEDYRPPIVKGMRRTPPAQRARARVLCDDELRKVWHAAGEAGTFGAIIKLALLTAQRSAKILSLRWQDIDVDGVWAVPAAPREKGNIGRVRLPEAALTVIRQQPRLAGAAYVFHVKPTYDRAKRSLDEKAGVTGWTVHDCRRTARSLLARAGIRHEVCEAVLGHAQRGVAGVYQRYSFDVEKAQALAQLAALIERIVNPPADNVVPLVAS
jgi:integrase